MTRVSATVPSILTRVPSVVVLKPHLLLRTASVLALAHALVNAFAGLLSGTSENKEEVVVLTAMKALQFDAMGSLRTYWDFYFGFGLLLTINLLLLSMLMWQLASLEKAESALARTLTASVCLAFVAFALVSARYFFIAQVLIEAAIALLLGLAYAYSGRRAPAHQPSSRS